MFLLRKIALILIYSFFVLPVLAEEIKLSSDQEERARDLFTELRCVVCQNQSIDSSDADVAKELRRIVRQQISEGKSEADIRDYLVARYGEFILLKPALGWHTILLWIAPLLALGVGMILIFGWFKSRNSGERALEVQALSEQEETRLAEILRDEPKD